jgi:uncharacterized paraquat-inducible protein A
MRCRKCGAATSVAVRTAGQKAICPPCRQQAEAEMQLLEIELVAKVEALKLRYNRRFR